MDITAQADQVLAAIRDGERLWPHNAELIEDEYFNHCVMLAANGRARYVIDAALHPVDTPVRFVSGSDTETGYISTRHVFDALRWDVGVECDRCAFNGRVFFGFEPDFQMVGILASPLIVLFLVCADCVTELERDYPSIVWGVELNGAV